MQSFGFLLGQRFFEETAGLRASVRGAEKYAAICRRSQCLHDILTFYAALGSWPPMANPVADFWLGYQSCQGGPQPKLKKIQLSLFS